MIITDPNGGSLKCRHSCAQILSKPFNCKIIHQRNCSAHQVHMLRIWSAKAAIFPWKLQRTQGREKRKIALIWSKTSRSGEIFSYLFLCVWKIKWNSLTLYCLTSKINFCLPRLYNFEMLINKTNISLSQCETCGGVLLEIYLWNSFDFQQSFGQGQLFLILFSSFLWWK